MDNPILHDSHLAPVIDPDYREYLPPTLSRRSGKLLKRALVVSRSVIEAAGTGCPDAILTGTGFGCVENTEAFLEAMTYEGEACLKPTAFMQSTHNTIGSLIAIDTHCHGYNSTYTHKGTSFECAFMDAYMQITRGQATTALVGGYDELTPHYYSMLSRTGYMGPASGCMGGEAAVSMMLCGNTGNRQPLCRVEGIELHYGSTLDGLGDALQRLTEGAGCTLSSIDAVMTGLNGNAANDAAYRSAARVLFPDTHILMYKHIFGEIRTSAGLAVYASATCLSKGRIPSFLSVGGGSAGSEHGGVQRILLYNHCENRAHSLILLSSC
ncbi:MAG: beta-ketoacyl synthase chain length factor [Tannerellaceae bacterium]|jgi:3-oxoacyl-(acyl-carrier-protein) synthase|nr:beta-ketoacyl synthase chain length factor [Tannerellaceae bacterium]